MLTEEQREMMIEAINAGLEEYLTKAARQFVYENWPEEISRTLESSLCIAVRDIMAMMINAVPEYARDGLHIHITVKND